jgi:hypothetical protein
LWLFSEKSGAFSGMMARSGLIWGIHLQGVGMEAEVVLLKTESEHQNQAPIKMCQVGKEIEASEME